MGQFSKLVYGDYLQRTRSYAFLITLAVSLYAAYSFVPPLEANYTTLRIGKYIGANNSAWTGYLTAMMTSIFLSAIGFYLINSNIKKDISTGVGMIIAATSITNFRYLFAKAISNFMLLLTITVIISIMSAVVFLVRPGSYSFQIMPFITPFLVITAPTLFFISAFAVFAEVVLYRYVIIMNIAFLFLFMSLLPAQEKLPPALDLMGIKPVIATMETQVREVYHEKNTQFSMGFNIGNKGKIKVFVFEGVSWNVLYVAFRLLWIGIGFGLIYISSLVFHRFDLVEGNKKQKKEKTSLTVFKESNKAATESKLKEIRLNALPRIKPAFGIIPLIKTELLMLYRKGPRWMWLLNIGGMVAISLAPLQTAHVVILPVLWFLQIARWSDLATKEKTYRIHYFTYASYKPLTRLFTAQLLAGIILSIGLSSPLLIRYAVGAEMLTVISILLGSIFIVLFAVFTGIMSGGKKLFEILFFFVTYCNLNKVPPLDYFGGLNHGLSYIGCMAILVIFLATSSYLYRRFEISRL
jgi:hypothetical protein